MNSYISYILYLKQRKHIKRPSDITRYLVFKTALNYMINFEIFNGQFIHCIACYSNYSDYLPVAE